MSPRVEPGSRPAAFAAPLPRSPARVSRPADRSWPGAPPPRARRTGRRGRRVGSSWATPRGGESTATYNPRVPRTAKAPRESKALLAARAGKILDLLEDAHPEAT